MRINLPVNLGIAIIVVFGLLVIGYGLNVTGGPDRAWHIVVQDVDVEPLAVTLDGRLLIGCEPRSKHVLHVVDIHNARTMLTIRLPYSIWHVATTPDGGTIAASAGRYRERGNGVYLINLDDGLPKLLIKDVGGALAFNKTGKQLAVLGNLAEPGGSDKKPISSSRTVSLGVYDIAARKWLGRADTPIVIPHFVAFDGKVAVGYGMGGSPYNISPRTFACHTRLDPATGKTSTKKGPVMRWGKPVKPENQPKESYKAPAFVAERKQALKAATKKLWKIKPKLSLSRIRKEKAMCVIGEAERIRFLGNRWFNDLGGWHMATFTITKSGNISVSEPVRSVSDRFQVCGQRFLEVRVRERPRRLRVRDAEMGKTIFDIPWKLVRGPTGSFHLAPEWLMTWKGDNGTFYGLQKGQVLGEATIKGVSSRPTFAPDHSRIAFPCRLGHDQMRIEVINAPSAIRVQTIQIDKRIFFGQVGIALDAHGRNLAVIFQRPPGRRHIVQVYDVATGERKLEVEVPDSDAYHAISTSKDRWLVYTSEGLRLLSSDGKLGEPLRGQWGFASVKELPRRTEDWVLIENRDNHGIIDLTSNTVIDRWSPGGTCAIAFDGRALVRPAAHLNDVDLVDLKTLKTLFTLHPVPVGKGFGWIATTLDGYWDASPGAEKYLTVFHGRELANPQETRGRRSPGLIGKAIGSLSKQ